MSQTFAPLSDVSSSDSEDESVLAHPCRWGWCRETLPTRDALILHLLDHTTRVVPVRRKDVALMRRIEEGTQQSLQISVLRDSLPGSVVASQQHAGLSEDVVHDKSLPSPPHSIGMLRTPASKSGMLLQDGHSSSSSSDSSSSDDEHDEQSVPPAISYPQVLVSTTLDPPKLSGQRQGAPVHITPTFASLNSPTNSQASQASRIVSRSIPDSPTFSSLVKRKSEIDHLQQLARSNPSSQSRSSTGSTGSQMSVEKQLTQSPRSDVASEPSASPRRKDAVNNVSPPALDNDITMSQHLYEAELAWDHAAEPENVFISQQPSQAVEFELLTQPPSQLQLGTFPFHNHRKSRNTGSSQAAPASSMPFRPSPPVPLTEKAFAASTPQPQPMRRQTRSQSRGPEPAPVQTMLQSTPVKRTISSKTPSTPRTPKAKSAKPRSRSFRSGTLQITPLAQSQPSTIAEETSQQLQQGLTAEELLNMHNPLHHFNGSPGRSQSSFESMDFADLQTQAPYDSQPMTQY